MEGSGSNRVGRKSGQLQNKKDNNSLHKEIQKKKKSGAILSEKHAIWFRILCILFSTGLFCNRPKERYQNFNFPGVSVPQFRC